MLLLLVQVSGGLLNVYLFRSFSRISASLSGIMQKAPPPPKVDSFQLGKFIRSACLSSPSFFLECLFVCFFNSVAWWSGGGGKRLRYRGRLCRGWVSREVLPFYVHLFGVDEYNISSLLRFFVFCFPPWIRQEADARMRCSWMFQSLLGRSSSACKVKWILTHV